MSHHHPTTGNATCDLFVSELVDVVHAEMTRRGVNQATIAREAGLTKATVSRTLGRARRSPDLVTLVALAGWAGYDPQLMPRADNARQAA